MHLIAEVDGHLLANADIGAEGHFGNKWSFLAWPIPLIDTWDLVVHANSLSYDMKVVDDHRHELHK